MTSPECHDTVTSWNVIVRLHPKDLISLHRPATLGDMTTRTRVLYEHLLWRVDAAYTPPTAEEVRTEIAIPFDYCCDACIIEGPDRMKDAHMKEVS